jgi:alkylated DNA repair dioxygenase AlkB
MSTPLGLSLNLEFITPEKEQEIIEWLDRHPWSNKLSRLTQHYGYEYDYTKKNILPQKTTPLTGPIFEIIQDYMQPDQCIVNEYRRNQGIAPHIDNLAFGPQVISISLGADTVMNFTRDSEQYDCFLPRRSAIMLEGPARYEWKHGIDKTVKYYDPEKGLFTKPLDYRRISLTYRTVNPIK